MIKAKINTPIEPFRVLYNLPAGTDIVICIGGRGGAKSHEVSKFTTFSCTLKKKRAVILRDEKEKIRESILQEIFTRYDHANQNGHLNQFFDKLETGIRDKSTGDMIIFTQGFRASSKDKKSNLKGVSGVDIAIVEEAEDIRSKEKFNTFRDSVRKEGSLVIVMLNTPDVNHWIIKTYFDLDPVLNEDGTGSGYFRLIPKNIPGFVAIQTNYEDNQFLPASVRERYKAYGDPESSTYDKHYYYTAILGYASSGRKGQILTKVKRISLADYLKLEYPEIYGLDFGESSPAGLIGMKIHRNSAWARELNYLPKSTLGIGIMLCDLGFTQKELIIADSAVPLDISKLRRGWEASELSPDQIEKYPQLLKGFNVMAAIKGPGSIESGLRIMRGMDLHVVDTSENFWNEIQNYIYAVDRNENPTEQPVDEFNHCFTADTMIDIPGGRYPISKINIGQIVLTSAGYKPVLRRFYNGIKQVKEYTISLSNHKIQIKCTPDHKVKTKEHGWIPITELQPEMTVYLSSHLMAGNTNFTQEKNTSQWVQDGCTLSYLNTSMDRLSQGIMSITKTKTNTITTRQTLSKWKLMSILANTCLRGYRKIRNLLNHAWITPGQRQVNGISLRKEENGTGKTCLVSTISGELKQKDAVINAVKNMNYQFSIQDQNSVQTSANQSTEENPELMISNVSVSSVERFSKKTNMANRSHVVESVVHHIESKNIGHHPVYDLMVDDQHEYIANGLLVHNCIDPWRYGITGRGRLY